MQTETQIQKEIIDYLELNDALVFRLNSGRAKNNVRLCPSGTPDLLAILPSRVLWIEVKKDKGTLRDSQVFMHNELTSRGQRVIVCRSLEDLTDEMG